MTRRRTVVIATATVLLGVGALLVGGIAMLTQTDRGRALVRDAAIPTLSAMFEGQLYIGTIHGSLFTDLTIDSLEIREPSGAPFLATGRISLRYDPRDLVDRRIVLRSLEADHVVMTMVDYGNDDWNYKRALKRRASRLPGATKSRLGQYFVLDTATLHEANLIVRLPWTLSDSLKGAKRDSALKYNLTRLDAEIRREPKRLTRTWRFVRGEIALGKSRLANPDTAGQQFAVQNLNVVWLMPPFWFRNMRTTIRKLGDSLWMNNATFNLAKSTANGQAKVVWGSGKPVRYDVKLHGDTVAMSDVAWIDEALPRTGAGSVDLTIKNDPRDLSVIEYGLHNLDARSMKSRLRGNMTFGVGGPVLRVTDVALDLVPANTDLLRQFNGEPFPYDWQGDLTARVMGRGGPVNRFVVENARFSFADAHVPGAVSSGSATGTVDIFTPSLAILRGVDLELTQLDLRTPRFVNPLFPEINGTIRGKARLDSLWFDARFTDADLVHVDGPGEPSRFTGSGRFTLLQEGVKFDVDMQAAPLSYTTLARSYPGLPLRGLAVGSIKAAGMAEDFAVTTTLAGEGGELTFSGRADAFEPEYSAVGTFHTRGANLRSLFGDPALPITNLATRGTANLTGATLTSLRGQLNAEMETASRFSQAQLYAGHARLVFDSGHVRVDTLTLESSAFTLSAVGGLGLLANRRDSLRFTMAIDSVGGLRQLISAGDSVPALLVAVGDTLGGNVGVRGVLSGSIDTLDVQGLRITARADANGLTAGVSSGARGRLLIDLDNILRSAHGTASVAVDSVNLDGRMVDSLTFRATVRDGLAERFGVKLQMPADVTMTLAGAITQNGDARLNGSAKTTTVLLDTLNIRVDTAGALKPRGFTLAVPAHLTLDSTTSGQLDSLVMVHTDTGTISLRGMLSPSGLIQGALSMDRVSIGDLGRLLQSPSMKTGQINANIVATGTRELPQFNGTLALRGAYVGPLRLEALDLRARYDSLRLNIDGVLTANERRTLSATASLPLDLALVLSRQRRLNQPLLGTLVSESVDLSTLEALFPQVSKAQGRLNTNVAMTGTWERPRFNGLIKLDSGSLSLTNLGVELKHVHADLALAGDTLIVRHVGASSGEASDSVSLTGRVSFSDWNDPIFDLRLAARNFLAFDRPRNATLTVSTTRPLTLFGPQHAALVRGGVRVDRGRVFVRALSQKRAIDLTDNLDVVDTSVVRMNALLPNAPSALVQNMTLDNVLVDIGDDVWLRSPEANIKLGGALRVTRAVGRDGFTARLAYTDSVTVERGTYQLNLGLARPTFEVERGVIRFFGDPDLEPALDISALHTIRETRANSNRQDVRIRVSIGGALNRLSLALSSADNPPLPESDMLSYLVTGEPAYALLGTPYSDQGATLALRLAGSYLSSRLAGGRFDVVQVEPTAIAPGDAANFRQNGLGILAATRVGLGLQVGRNTYLNLSTGLCGLASTSASSADALSLFAQGLGVKAERRMQGGLSLALGLEPGSSAQACGRLGVSRTFQQTPPQFGLDLFKSWAW